MSAQNNFSPAEIKPWYSYMGGSYHGPLPAFYDNEKWEWLTETEKQFSIIRSEIEALLSSRNNSLEPYFNSSLTGGKGKWEVLNFYFWGKAEEKNCAACPQLNQLLKKIPGLLTATVSRLSPHTEIHPHIGDTNMVARCHLGLIIPGTLPDCGIDVNNEQRSWEEGKWLLFCDAYTHSAWNRTDQPRFVLIVDVVLPEFAMQTKNISANVRSLLKLQKVIAKKPWIGKLPGPLLGVMRHFYKFTL
ncbi:MAG: aspartyl/asparaginyl beta-hydroxylase domain-containing protein [Bacteroidota bacterium]|nr:aspartyl/asparaginyl beta-hydroxylase domain-containing protein [Bacteroidota bacterium]